MKTNITRPMRVVISYKTKNNRGSGSGGSIPMFVSPDATDDQIKAEFLKENPLIEDYEEQLTEFEIQDRQIVERWQYKQDHPITCPRRVEGFDYGEKEKDHVRENGTCSFCGSIMPELFWELVEAGAEVGPTDKNYKAYVEPHPYLKYTVMASGMVKVYFQHFGPEDKTRFIQMLNDGKIKIGYPGHFYRLPFFCKKAE